MDKKAMEPVDDGLPVDEVGTWAEEKHVYVSMYAKLFSTGMKHKWGKRVYLELYAGSGHSRIRNSSKLIAGSPLHALAVTDPFDKYIFCEKDADKMNALKTRALRRHLRQKWRTFVATVTFSR